MVSSWFFILQLLKRFLERATNILEFRENLYPSCSIVLIETRTLLPHMGGLNIGPSAAKCTAFHTPLATHLCSPRRLFVRPYLTLPLSILTLSTQYDVNIHVAPTGVLFPRRLPHLLATATPSSSSPLGCR